MSIEDFIHPLLATYIASPQWLKSTIGRAYAMIPTAVVRGRNYQQFFLESTLTDEHKIKQISSLKLAQTLRCAIESVPAYRDFHHLLKQLDSPLEALRQLPLMTKGDIQKNSARFLSTRASSKHRLTTFTGGSTAAPMMFYLHKGITRTKEYAFIENFHQRIGLSQQDVILALRGREVPTAKNIGGKLWMYEPIKRHLILSSDHLKPHYMADYVEAIRRWKPTYIQAYPSAIYPLARWLKANPDPVVTERIKGIMLFSENVLEYHMELLKEVFDCPVLKHYGQSERLLMAASMPDDARYFFWPQYGHFELVDEAGRPITQPGILGEIVGTGFDNHVMPFIRYRTGDMAMLSDRPHPLLLGFPVVERIEGRRQEFLVCRDHRLISINSMSASHSSDLALAGVDSIQYEQHEPGHFMLKVVASKPLSAEARHKIKRGMEAKTQGGCTMEVIEVSDIHRTPRGKHQMLIQRLDVSRYFWTAASEPKESMV